MGGPNVTPAADPWFAQAGGRVYANRLVSGTCRYRYEPDRVRASQALSELTGVSMLVAVEGETTADQAVISVEIRSKNREPVNGSVALAARPGGRDLRFTP